MNGKIGIIVCGFTKDRQFVTNSYIQAVRYSGGIPLLLPVIRSDRIIREYLSLCDGFLFCGGDDITPLLFGQEPQRGNGKTNITLDLFQIRFMRFLLGTGKPVLAICRGMQVMNVACGGTIWQDLSLVPGRTLDHMQKAVSRQQVSHRVRIEKDSILGHITGKIFYVNSYHHQAVDRPGESVRVTARAGDGIIEAIELKSHPFAVGIQWHPECMFRSSPEMRGLFHEFIFAS